MSAKRSIAAGLTGINMLVSGAALLVAALVFIAYDQSATRSLIVRNLSTQAQIVSTNSVTALVFNDSSAAEDTLAALRAADNIVSAAIYGPDGEPFALYQRDGLESPVALSIPADQSEAYRFDDDSVALARNIVLEDRIAGTVSLRSDLSELAERRRQYLGIGGAVLTVSLLAAGLLSWISQRAISQPIVRLAETARRISSHKDYSLRADASNQSREVAALVGAFNEMVSQVQERDRALHLAHDQLEERVRLRTAELDAVNQELEAFTYSVSHDLRAPLRHVTGFAGLLEEHANGRLDAEGLRYLQTIGNAAKRMGRLIDDLLAFSRVGRTQIVKYRVNLNDLVREARDEITGHPDEGSAAAPPVRWQVAPLPEVEADRSMLRQVMVNLLSNALKYTSSKRSACIEVGSYRQTDKEVVIFVRDNGVGFDMQFAHKLFGVFQRLHSSDDFEGTGIGLANVKRIIHRHGGRVWAEGQIDQGATFSFSLPTTESTT